MGLVLCSVPGLAGRMEPCCEMEVSETEGGNGRGENTEEGPKELVPFKNKRFALTWEKQKGF